MKQLLKQHGSSSKGNTLQNKTISAITDLSAQMYSHKNICTRLYTHI